MLLFTVLILYKGTIQEYDEQIVRKLIERITVYDDKQIEILCCQAKSSVLESMRKLQTEYLDLVLLHQPFSDAYGAWRALEELYEEGKFVQSAFQTFVLTVWLILLHSIE